MKSVTFSTLLMTVLLTCLVQAQPPIDLSGIAFIVDPGHSDNENVSIYRYAEAHKVLDVAGFLENSNVDVR